ncbi:MAG: hypothetical protein Q9223_004056 [Gallowayella weberi]
MSNYASLPPGIDLSQVATAQPPPGVKQNFVNPESTAGTAIAVTVFFTALMFIFVCMRLYTKFFISRSKGWDDYMRMGTLNAASAFYGPVMFFTKLSLFILYYRLFNPSNIMRYLIFFGVAFNFLFYTIYLFIYAFYCPNTSKRAPTCEHSIKDIGVVAAAINIASDFYILLIPLCAISNLQLPPKRKLGLLAIFFTGFL